MGIPQPSANAFQEESAHDARAVANLLLDMAALEAIELTNLKIQKLIYFAHAESLVRYQRALVRQPFEAWEMGPVVKPVYDQFKAFKDRPILQPARSFDVAAAAWIPVPYTAIGPGARATVQLTLASYGRVSAFHLSDLTHQPGSPWHIVRTTPTSVANVGLQISNSLIFAYFGNGAGNRLLN